MQKSFAFFLSSCFLLMTTTSIAQGNDTLNVTDAKGWKQGVWKKHYESGKVRYRGVFKDDKPTGTFIYYDKMGNLFSKIKHVGKGKAEATFFHINGKVLSKGTYINRKKEGEWLFFDNKGILSRREFYEDDVLNGTATVYYIDGKVAKEATFENGLEQDTVREYFPDGSLKYVANYIDGNPDSTVTFYHPNGKIRLQGKYRDAVRHGKWVHFDDREIPLKWEFYYLGELRKTVYNEENPNLPKEALEPEQK